MYEPSSLGDFDVRYEAPEYHHFGLADDTHSSYTDIWGYVHVTFQAFLPVADGSQLGNRNLADYLWEISMGHDTASAGRSSWKL